MGSVKKQVLVRFAIIYVLILIIFVPLVSYKIWATMSSDGDFWRAQGRKVKSTNVEIKPSRGNILAEDGRLLATTVPTYTLYMDFRADGLTVGDTFKNYVNVLADSLAMIYHVSPSDMKKHLMTGYARGSRYWKLNKKRISFVDYQRVKKFPLFCKGSNKSGLVADEHISRKFPYGDMGSRSIGGLYAEEERGKSGLEMAFDSILRGEPGLAQQVYIGGRYRKINMVEPVSGKDVQTTLNVDMMDLAEKSLRHTLSRVEADHGCVVVMEVKTGAIRVMCNLQRNQDGSYTEGRNYAVSSQTQPGSTFKIASSLVLLENGVDTSTVVDTENGTWTVHGQVMRDWDYGKKDVPRKISLNKGIQKSSNIVVAKLVEEKYGKNNEERWKFIRALYDLGLNTPLNIEIPGAARPSIKNPDDEGWSLLSLPWISHGYELKFPPLNLLTFFNGLANDGKMIQPYLVRSINRNGRVLEDKEKVTVIKDRLCSAKTLDKLRQMMIDVVEEGTAKSVHSENFLVAGKTGTAVEKVHGARKHQLTFCGFFPADKPQYSMVVVVWYPELGYPSAGAISGEVFKNVAEGIYAMKPISIDENARIAKIPNEEKNLLPVTKDGNMHDLIYSLDELDIPYNTVAQVKGSSWVRSSAKNDAVQLSQVRMVDGLVPNVIGMGAKDAVYLLENRGLKVSLSGVGSVVSQSIQNGTRVAKGSRIELILR